MALLVLGVLAVLPSFARPPRGAGGWRPPAVVQIDGGERWVVWSPLYPHVFAGVQKGRPFHLPLREGDLVFAGSGPRDCPFTYRATDGLSMVVAKTEVGTALAGKVISLDLDKGPGWEWLRGATPQEVSSLRLLSLSEHVPLERVELLRKVADGNPYVDLFVSDHVRALDDALSVFAPERLWLADLSPTRQVQRAIGSQPRLHTLAIECEEPSDLAFLGRQRALKTLTLINWNPAKSGPLPDELPALRSLLVFGGDLKDLAAIGRQPRLEELTLAMVKPLEDVSRLSEFPALQTLCLQGCRGVSDLGPLRGLKNLKWLALPPATTQRQLNAVVRDHPHLLILAAVGAEHIDSLTPVRRLTDLTALMILTRAPLDPLYRMRNLDFLAVSVGNDTEKFAAALGGLQQALPDTAIDRVAPVCLGSGWILLLAPAVAVAWWLAARRKRPRADVRHA